VLVCTVRAVKFQSGRYRVRSGKPLPEALLKEDLAALQSGAENLQAHVEIIRKFGLPVVVAINRFPEDSPRELDAVRQIALDAGATAVAISDAFMQGSEGALRLAAVVMDACRRPNQFRFLYPREASPEWKIETIAREIYGADGVDLDTTARKSLDEFARLGHESLPVCIAKTQHSLSHDPQRLGRPRGFRLPIHSVRLSAGAGFLYALAGNVKTMPGLPADPAARHIDLDSSGRILGMH
jgi:formyltetrahydrofolate synthetase